MPDLYAHDHESCQLSVATLLLFQVRQSLKTVARISGDRTLAMVAKYVHANGEHIQAATDKLERRYQHTG